LSLFVWFVVGVGLGLFVMVLLDLFVDLGKLVMDVWRGLE